jgi:transposase
MKYFAGIDVSLEESHVCIVEETGRIVKEAVVASEPEALAAYLLGQELALERVGLEAGPLSQWLHAGLRSAGLASVCIETRQLKAALSAAKIKTDRKDARGIAEVVRTGWYQEVHVKSLEAQETRVLLEARALLQKQVGEVSSSIRGLLRNFGLKVGKVGKAAFAARVRELVASRPSLSAVIEPMLASRETLRKELAKLDRQAVKAAGQSPVCRRLMTAGGVAAIVALTYTSGIDDPYRFKRSQDVGAYLGLIPKRYQSGEVDRIGQITKVGDGAVRKALYQAANTILTRPIRWSPLKAWAMRVAQRRGMKRAKVALARKLAVVLHRMWVDGSEFRWSRHVSPVAAA